MQLVFYRVEQKYMITKQKLDVLQNILREYMDLDEHGTYTLCNIYYDTENSDLIKKSLEKPLYKEKFRIRSYGIPTLETNVFLEIKKKYRGVVNKRRITLKLQDAYNYIEKGIKPEQNSQILQELDYFIGHYKLKPTVFISYDRIAYQDRQNSNFRVTFDTNLISRKNDLKLENGIYGENMLNDNIYIMEVKTLGAIPLWFTHILSDFKIYPTSFSKYGEIYKNSLIKKGA